MTEERPEGGAEWGSDSDAYTDPSAFHAAVEALNDPLNDPLPGQLPEPFPEPFPEPEPEPFPKPGPFQGQPPGGLPVQHGRPMPEPGYQEAGYDPYPYPYPYGQDPETVGLRRSDDLAPQGGPPPVPVSPVPVPPAPDPTGGRAARRRAARAAEAPAVEDAAPSPGAGADVPPVGGRAARRKAEQGGGRRGAAQPAAAEPPLSGGRAARRRAAKAAKQTGTAISNVIGELFITTGVLLLLFVVYQLWWTNFEARAHANNEADRLTEQWEDPGTGPDEEARDPGTFSPGEGFAILYLPTLDVRVPIAESVDPAEVLDNGMVGHYTESDELPTAMPWDEEGNVGLAGHRNTHGEPFRYINRLEPGDPIVVETESSYYTYEMTSRLDSTSPSNTAVLDPVPDQGGFSDPGRYITLTTCTPEFTSTYRLIVWGQMIEERPRSEGKPDALVN